MKKIILIVLLIAPIIVKSQITSNIISETDFNNIKINNVSFSNIKASNGSLNQLNNLFTENISENTQEVEENYFYYVFDGFDICFSDNEVSSFSITNTNWNITILGEIVTIGSHKDVLGNVIVNNQVGGGKSIVYQYCDGCNNFLSFYLDSNNLITKIIYMEQT